MHKGPLLALLVPGVALANEPVPMARASFPVLTEASAEAAPARESSLDRLSPKVVGALPLLPPKPSATPAPSTRAVSSPPPAPVWETSVSRAPPARAPMLDQHEPRASSSRETDLWMLSLEGATRAPVDAGFQLTLETPPGLRAFGTYGWVPSMYLGRVMGTASQISADPMLSAVLERGFERGRAWRVGAGWRPFRRVGAYLDAGYARVSTSGGFDASDLTGTAVVAGSYSVESSIGMGFVEVGYQAKVAERVVLALALGATKVLSAETRVAPEEGGATDPNLEKAAGWVDQGLEKYGFLPTLTLRLGIDMI